MKKTLVLLIILLTACSMRDDYFELSVDDYSITVGYDDGKYMDIAFDYDIKDELEANEIINNVDIYLFNDLLGIGEFSNSSNKNISSKKAKLTGLTLYVNDLNGRVFKLNGEILDDSIKSNCDKFNGTYIEKNGYACVIEDTVNDDLNVVELHGDYLAIDQDKLDHIDIYVK